jgi:hypothetical protein
MSGSGETVGPFGWRGDIDKDYASLSLNYWRHALLFSFYAILTGRTTFALQRVRLEYGIEQTVIANKFYTKGRLTFILRRAQATHLVRLVRRSSGPTTAISQSNCGEYEGISVQDMALKCPRCHSQPEQSEETVRRIKGADGERETA